MKTILIILSAFLFSCVTKNYITNNYYPAENKFPLGGVVTPFYGMETSPTFTKTLESFTKTPYVIPDIYMSNPLRFQEIQAAPTTTKTLEYNPH